MSKTVIVFTSEEYDALSEIASEQKRTIKQQAEYFLSQSLSVHIDNSMERKKKEALLDKAVKMKDDLKSKNDEIVDLKRRIGELSNRMVEMNTLLVQMESLTREERIMLSNYRHQKKIERASAPILEAKEIIRQSEVESVNDDSRSA